jgi:hypothetical protein
MLIPIFTDAEQSLAEFGATAERLHLVMGTKAAKAADAFGDKLDTLKFQARMAAITIGFAAMPVFQSLVDMLSRGAEAVARFADAHPRLFRWITSTSAVAGTFALGIGSILYVLPNVITGIQYLAAAYRSLTTWINASNVALLKNPILLAAVAAVLSAIGSLNILKEEGGKVLRGEQTLGKGALRNLGRQATPLGPAVHGGQILQKMVVDWLTGGSAAPGMGMPAPGGGTSGGTTTHEVKFSFEGKDIDGERIANHPDVQRAIKEVSEDMMRGRDIRTRHAMW